MALNNAALYVMLAKTHLEDKVSKALGKVETMGDELVV